MVSIGPAQFVTHPGEAAPIFALELRNKWDSSPKKITGLGMDAFGYIQNQNILKVINSTCYVLNQYFSR